MFAKESIRKGEIVSVRGGHIITRQMEKNVNKPDGYWGYPIADEFVLAPLNTQEVEDVMMFLNHSCDPNVGILGHVITSYSIHYTKLYEEAAGYSSA